MILPVIVLAAFALRAAYAMHSHPFIDEFTTLLASRSILRSGFPILPSGLFYEHGLLFSYLDAPFVSLGAWLGLPVGSTGWYVFTRLPALLIGVVSVPALYQVTRRTTSVRAGLIAAALLAFSPEGMVWGARARMYALAQLLSLVLAFLVFQGCLGRGRTRLRWLALLVLSIALLNHFGTLILVPPLVVGGVAVGWLGRKKGEKPWFLQPAAFFQGVVLAGIVIGAVLIKRLGQPIGMAPLNGEHPGGIVGELWNTISYQASLTFKGAGVPEYLARQFGVPHHVWLALAALVGGVVTLVVWGISRRNGRLQVAYPSWTLYLWLLVGLPILEVIALVDPWRRNPRYLVMILPWFYLLVATGIEQVLAVSFPKGGTLQQPDGKAYGRRKPVLAGLVALAVAAWGVAQAYGTWIDLKVAYQTPEPAYEEAFSYVAGEWRPGDVLTTMNTSAAGLYFDRVDYFAIQEDADQFLLDEEGQQVDRWLGAPWLATGADLNRVLAESPRAWFVVDTIRLPVYYRGDWLAVLESQMVPVWDRDEALVYRTRPGALSLPLAPNVEVDAGLGGTLRLEGYYAPQTPLTHLTPGEAYVYPLTLFWLPAEQVVDDYTVFVHVRDRDGGTVAQDDAQPLGGRYPTSQWRVGETVVDPHPIELPSNLPPGEYRVWIGMYDLDTLERLPVENDLSGENAIPLGTIIVP